MNRRSALDWLLEAVSAAALIGAIADVSIHWSTLPDRIPTHFDMAGNPNGWGGKNSLLILLGTTAAMFIVLTVAGSYQRLINIPIRVDRESPAVRRLLRRMVIVMKAVITIAFAGIAHLTIGISMGQMASLGHAFLPLFLFAVFGPVVYFVVRLKRL